MDWKSILQVKEMGVAVEDCQELAADAGKYFDAWWAFSATEPASAQVFDPLVRIYRRGRLWCLLRNAPDRRSPPTNSPRALTARTLYGSK
jgi:hypothetical protein